MWYFRIRDGSIDGHNVRSYEWNRWHTSNRIKDVFFCNVVQTELERIEWKNKLLENRKLGDSQTHSLQMVYQLVHIWKKCISQESNWVGLSLEKYIPFRCVPVDMLRFLLVRIAITETVRLIFFVYTNLL